MKTTDLLNLFVSRMLVAVTTEFAQLEPSGGIPAVFHCRVAGYTSRAFSSITATLSAFQGDDNPNALFGCHTLYRPNAGIK